MPAAVEAQSLNHWTTGQVPSESVPLRYKVDSVHKILKEGCGLRNTKHHLFVCCETLASVLHHLPPNLGTRHQIQVQIL